MDDNNDSNGKGGIAQTINKAASKHPAILLSTLYVYFSAVGIVYLWSLFRQFGLNLIYFAEANDLLLAAFKEPQLFLAALLMVIMPVATEPFAACVMGCDRICNG